MAQEIGKDFIELTKYRNLSESPQKQGVSLPALQVPLDKDVERISLSSGKEISLEKIDLIELVEKRQTFRKYAEGSLTLSELAYLLWGTQGVKEVTGYPVTKRTVPSAGSRHPFETYLLVNRVDALEPGLYRYLALEHQLAKLPAPDDICERLTIACGKQVQVRNSAATFFWVADVMRTIWRYTQRGYRYMFLDAGHVCQNLYLLAGAIDCGVCAIGAYDDDLVNQELGIDGESLFTIYIASLGRLPK